MSLQHPNFTRFLREYEKRASTSDDRELIGLFTKHRQSVGEHFESCLEYVAPLLSPGEPFIDGFGPTFHKGFRQTDVTPSGRDDARIWALMQSPPFGSDTCFWETLALSPSEVELCP